MEFVCWFPSAPRSYEVKVLVGNVHPTLVECIFLHLHTVWLAVQLWPCAHCTNTHDKYIHSQPSEDLCAITHICSTNQHSAIQFWFMIRVGNKPYTNNKLHYYLGELRNIRFDNTFKYLFETNIITNSIVFLWLLYVHNFKQDNLYYICLRVSELQYEMQGWSTEVVVKIPTHLHKCWCTHVVENMFTESCTQHFVWNQP